MPSDITSLLERSALQPTTEPDWLAILRRGDVLRRRRIAIVAFALLLTMGGVYAFSNVIDSFNASRREPQIDPARTGEEPFEPAQPGESTYKLASFAVHYPYVSPRERSRKCRPVTGRVDDCRGDLRFAGVEYSPEWTTDTFPGDGIRCRIRLWSEDGALVGNQVIELTALSPNGYARMEPLRLPVDAAPTRADGVCEAGTYDAESDLDLTWVDARQVAFDPSDPKEPARTALTFRVGWDGEGVPGTRLCRGSVTFDDGSRMSLTATTMYIDDDEVQITPAITDPASIAGAHFVCEPLTLLTATPETVKVPNVLHRDLRVAYEQLVEAGLRVAFARDVRRYEAYAVPSGGLEMSISPAPHVGAMSPQPGKRVKVGSTVVILDTECPNRARGCL